MTGWNAGLATGDACRSGDAARNRRKTTTCWIVWCRSPSYTGIDGINVQDRAIRKHGTHRRSKEHLGPTDKGYHQARKLRMSSKDGGSRRYAG